jgi:hypothetical protein
MIRSVLVAIAFLAASTGNALWAQGTEGCYILAFEPGTMIPEYDCQYQKSGPRPPAFAGTWYAAIAKSAGHRVGRFLA